MASLESCRIPKTNFLVDLFRRPPKGDWIFFLSHFHSDHYGGITKKWKNGPIYCSKITSNFLKRRIEVSEKYVFDLELNKKIVFGEYTVTLIDANHCFGAVMFVFEETPPGSKIYIHTGDFRFHEKMLQNISKYKGCDALFLDTTYYNVEFPPRKDVIQDILSLVHE
eukprot:GHVL01044935.1.p1 GENE.GHVL01044935.1~~GHVL01044935.1.p1  ORF type:complete len:167 (-),score=29.30 GHVL01044935.1:109-609(-)